jgi:hemerythrin-like domain-containing protein
MITFEELNKQNDKITQLSNILDRLIQDRLTCDNPVVTDLFFRYRDEVKHHLDLEDKHIYADLLGSSDEQVNKTVKLFMSGSAEIKKIFDRYLRHWCKGGSINIGDHEKFVAETEKMFDLVLKRIQDEVEHLYPMIRKVDPSAVS